MSPLFDRIDNLAKNLQRPAVQHFSIAGETQTLCRKNHNAKLLNEFLGLLGQHEAVHGYKRNWRDSYYANSFYQDAESVFYRKTFADGKLHICAPCHQAWKIRVADNAQALLSAKPRISRERARRADVLGKKNGMLPLHRRPLGTEEMTGHFEEGSKGGGCGKGGAEFLTTYLPWITCGACLVTVDWVLEEGLYVFHGKYLVKAPPYPECVITETVASNSKSQSQGWHFNWVIPAKAPEAARVGRAVG